MDANSIDLTTRLMLANDTQLFEELEQLLQSEVEFQQMLVMLESAKGPELLYEKIRSDYTHDQLTKPYLEGAYLLDPFYQHLADSNEQYGFFHLIDVTPEGFYLSAFYEEYYKNSGMLDELQYWSKVGDGLQITINIGRTRESRFLTPQELARFREFLPLVNALIQRYWQQAAHAQQVAAESHPGMRERLDQALACFGSSVLTQRECEVVQMILSGYSTKSAAQKLGISPETVHMHRKNIYGKLDISSQSEVFTLFLDAVAEVDPDFEGDPLLVHATRS